MTEQKLIKSSQVQTVAELFRKRVTQSPDAIAYQHYDWAAQRWVDTSWAEMAREVGRWQQALMRSGLQQGDHVALMLRNSREWVLLDQAAAGLGMVTVPLYVGDRPENAAYILNQAHVKLLLVENKEQWQSLLQVGDRLPELQQIISLVTIAPEDKPQDARLESMSDWLFGLQGELQTVTTEPDDLATLVYTSGTTGNPKGVMLTHRNILSNAGSAIDTFKGFLAEETFLSVLPLSHMLERTVGYYLPMMCGYSVAFNRSIQQMPDDLLAVKPSIFISVPRIYERFYAKVQEQLRKASFLKRALFSLALKVGGKRHAYRQNQSGWSPLLLLWPLLQKLVAKKVMEKLGGQLHIAICGGAALSTDIERFFTSLGLNLYQGYGLTESSPVISVNREGMSKLGSIGPPLEGVQVRISDDGELQSKSDAVMQGYWENPEATAAAFTEDGWLRTGDLARVDEDGCIYITGRSKDIVVLSNGEKVPPADMEMAIAMDPLIEQVMIIGEGRPALTAIAVLNQDVWHELAADFQVDAEDEQVLSRGDIKQRLLHRIAAMLKRFPGYAQIKNIHATFEPWTIENEFLTPTLKLKRTKLQEYYQQEINGMYRR